MSTRQTFVKSFLGKTAVLTRNFWIDLSKTQVNIMETKTAKKATPVAAAASGKVYKVGSRVGRGVPDITGAYTKKCSCKRDKTIVFCRACGYYCNGRIRLKCEQHPRVTFLLDISECPRCHCSVFLDEYVKA